MLLLAVFLRRLRYICLVALLTVWGGCIAVADDGNNHDNQSVATTATDDMVVQRIGLIDIEGVLRASTGTLRVRELLDEQRESFQQEIGAQELDLQSSELELLERQKSISKAEFDRELASFQERVSDLQQQIQYRRQALDEAFQDAQRNLRQMALEIVKDIAAERALDLVLVRDSALIFKPSLNISDEVLKRLNERTKNARIEIKTNAGSETE